MHGTQTIEKLNKQAEETARERRERREREAIASVEVGDRFKDNDKRCGDRVLLVTNVIRTPNGPGAAVATVIVKGVPQDRSVSVRLDRLVTKHLFTKLQVD